MFITILSCWNKIKKKTKKLPGSLFFLLEEDKCHPNPCKNGGVCTEANGQYVCTCAEGFKGINCQGLILFCSYIMRTARSEINEWNV